MVQNLDRDEIGCILFDDDAAIQQGSKVSRTGRVAGIPAGDKFLGRVVDALGSPIDGLGPIESDGYRPDRSARAGYHFPPAGESAHGDGAFDHRLHVPHWPGPARTDHRRPPDRQDRHCAGYHSEPEGEERRSAFMWPSARRPALLPRWWRRCSKHDALEYTIVVSATASDSAPLQYIAPYAGCALGEYFMQKGRDVLIVYDDLSKHAVAYRALSLLLGRSPGREAYPGDVFYLHSRLLERAAASVR